MPGAHRTRVVKAFWAGLGGCFLVIGLVGVVVPLLPTTPFLILAAACFAKGSERMHAWLTASRWLGPYLRAASEGTPLTWKWRLASLAFLWTSIGLAILFLTDEVWARAVLLITAALVSWHLSTVGRPRSR